MGDSGRTREHNVTSLVGGWWDKSGAMMKETRFNLQ